MSEECMCGGRGGGDSSAFCCSTLPCSITPPIFQHNSSCISLIKLKFSLRTCTDVGIVSGKLEEVEREKIEQQVAEYVRSCTENIRILEAGIQRNTSTTPQVNAYQHGVVSFCFILLHIDLETATTPRLLPPAWRVTAPLSKPRQKSTE